jgi:hypothetical protein
MTKERRSDIVFGIILLLIGGWFLAAQFNLIPGLNELINIQFQWPWIVIGVGLLLFFLGLLTHNPGLSVPACIVGGIGGILYYNNLTGNWFAWSYLWSLIPGFVGVGILLATLLGSGDKSGYREGLRLILISAILFLVSFLLFSGQGLFIQYWPVLLILTGIWVIYTAFTRRK